MIITFILDSHKYLPNQYLSESSQSAQQQGLWSAAPPSRQQQQQQQQHHHADLSVKSQYIHSYLFFIRLTLF